MAEEKKLGLSLLVLLGVGSMIGGGIFNSPTDFINVANPQATLIAWLIGGIGVVFLALVFQLLANKKPELTGGIFAYAQAGFGDFTGFNSAWGYWLSAWLGNVAFFVLLFKTFNSLIGGMSPLMTFIAASVLLWVLHLIQLKGSQSAGFINGVVTLAKLIPLLLVVGLGIIVFKSSTFNVANWQTTLASVTETAKAGTSIGAQVKDAMTTILWCFIGVEAATVLSERAESQKIVGKATVISILITLALYMSVSLIAMGIIDAQTLAGAETPLADVLSKTAVGAAGGYIVKVGLILSLFGGLVSWIMLAAEIPFICAKGGAMPKWFAKTNENGTPTNSLLLTDILTQLFLLSLLLPALQTAYSKVFGISTACILVPYLLSAAYALKVSFQENYSAKDKFVSILATVYSVYVMYATKEFVLLTFIMYAIGIPVYVKARKEHQKEITSGEKIYFAVVVILAIAAIALVATGKIEL